MSNPFNFDEALGKAEAEFGQIGSQKGAFYKIKEGKNRVRVLTPLYPYASHFKAGACVGKADCPECKKVVKDKDGKDKENLPSIKFICHVLDMNEPTKAADKTTYPIKLAQFPLGIFLALRDLQNDPEWSFNELPMPYDITINAEGAGKTTVKYSVVASPKREPVAAETLETLSKISSPEDFKTAMIKKQKKLLGLTANDDDKGIDYPTEEISPDDIDAAFDRVQ